MEIKEEIINTLKHLKTFGFSRRKIESELDYSVGYIDQQLSLGGSKKLLVVLKLLLKVQVLENTISELTGKHTKPKSIKDLRPLDGAEGDRAALKALVQAVTQLQEIVFTGLHEKPIDLYQIASSILDERHGGTDLEGLEKTGL